MSSINPRYGQPAHQPAHALVNVNIVISQHTWHTCLTYLPSGARIPHPLKIGYESCEAR